MLKGLPILITRSLLLKEYEPFIPKGTIKELVFCAKETAPNLNGRSNSFVLFLVPSGNIPIAPPLFKTFIAFKVAVGSFSFLFTGIQCTILKNQLVFLLSKYSFLAM